MMQKKILPFSYLDVDDPNVLHVSKTDKTTSIFDDQIGKTIFSYFHDQNN